MIKSEQFREIEKRLDTATNVLQAIYRNGRFARRGDGWIQPWQYETIQKSLNDIPDLVEGLSTVYAYKVSELLKALIDANDELKMYHEAQDEGRILPKGIHLTIMGDTYDGTYVAVSSDGHLGAGL